jgi:hypothetical protein
MWNLLSKVSVRFLWAGMTREFWDTAEFRQRIIDELKKEGKNITFQHFIDF